MTGFDPAPFIAAFLQGALILAIAPLLLGITKRVKARLQYRRGPGLLQPYRDLAKWWRKEAVESEIATPLTALAPAIVLAATLLAALLVPLVTTRPPLGSFGDLLVVVGLLALVRFVLALAALDAGSAFGGMGSSRETAIAVLVEPVILFALAGAAAAASSTDLGQIATVGATIGTRWLTPSLLLCGAAFAVIAVAETGHEPFDNPDTHLELTMVHEGMLLEATGPRLAMFLYAAEIKTVVVAALFVAAFLPMGAATALTPWALAFGLSVAAAKLVIVAVALALLDATLAKLRILALPGLVGSAATLALVGLAARLWLPA